MEDILCLDYVHLTFFIQTLNMIQFGSWSGLRIKLFFFLILIIIKNTHKGQKVLTFNDIAQAT